MSAQTDLTESAAEDAGAADAGLGLNPLVSFGTTELVAGFQQIAQHAVRHPWVTMECLADLAGTLTRTWTYGSTIEPARGDRRFADPAWTSNPLYHAILQSYLAWRASLDRWIANAGFDYVNEQRARFILSQLGDALAPTNTWPGNPAAIRRFFETGGVSAAHGLLHMLHDLARNGGLPSQVDKRAFRVGENLGATQGAVVFRNEQAELLQYAPKSEQVFARPLLIVPPQINKFYLFDLAPGRSVVEYPSGKWDPGIRGKLAQPDCCTARLGRRYLRACPGRSHGRRPFDRWQRGPEHHRRLLGWHHRNGPARVPCRQTRPADQCPDAAGDGA